MTFPWTCGRYDACKMPLRHTPDTFTLAPADLLSSELSDRHGVEFTTSRQDILDPAGSAR